MSEEAEARWVDFDPDGLNEFPFIERHGSNIVDWRFWANVTATGDDEADHGRGRDYANALIALAKNCPGGNHWITMVLIDLVGQGRYRAVECGFLARIAQLARLGSQH